MNVVKEEEYKNINGQIMLRSLCNGGDKHVRLFKIISHNMVSEGKKGYSCHSAGASFHHPPSSCEHHLLQTHPHRKSQKTVNHVALMETETQINKNMLISPVWPVTLWKGLSWMTQFTYTKTRKQTAGQSCWIKLQYTPASQAQRGYRKLLCTGNFM